MGVEIERKFLTLGGFLPTGPGTRFVQGYLNDGAASTVRVRIAGERAFLTIKGRVTGISRAEFEYEVPVTDAVEMLTLSVTPLVEKVRHIVPFAGHAFEVDVFEGKNAGLVVAELELTSEEQTFERPPWLGEEVSSKRRYANSVLARRPYSEWSEDERRGR